MSAVATAECLCEHITADVMQCPVHFHLWKAGRRLASIGSIIRQTFPMDPSIPPEKLENARERGDETDRLISGYLAGTLAAIPAGTRRDSIALFEKVRTWFDRQHFKEIQTQVVLGDADHGGVVDLILDGMPVDLKATYNVEHTHRLQVAAYAALCHDAGQILHVTERLKEPRLVPLEQRDYDDWAILLAHWRMQQRRGK